MAADAKVAGDGGFAAGVRATEGREAADKGGDVGRAKHGQVGGAYHDGVCVGAARTGAGGG
jgi:hypothetical protein